ncbi:MAG: hypothetical protein MJZ70_04430, partial [Bacteroidales bacterium]|nr:hypothetical protein [Bacteroidales bacterium]
ENDIKSLQSHIPEYIEIERKTKADDTWLKMPDGSAWSGDPRSWVQLMSVNGKYYDNNIIFTGVRGQVNPEYNGLFWGIQGNGMLPAQQARRYSWGDNNVLQLVVPQKLFTYDFNAQGRRWFDIEMPHNLPVKGSKSNDLVNYLLGKQFYDRVNMYSILDPGEQIVPKSSRYWTEEALWNTLQNNVIINEKVPRKSIVGGNGDFNFEDKNMYRQLGGKIN